MPEAVPASGRVRNLIVCGHVNKVLRQRCQPGTTPICKIMTKNPYNLQTNPYNLSTHPAVTHPYRINKQNTTCCVTDHLLSCSRNITGVIAH